MKKLLIVLLSMVLITGLFGCSSKSDLPLPEVSDGVRGDLGIDKNINEDTIDEYLNRSDAVYRDMRMLEDEARFEAIGGDSKLTGFVKGFEVVPYPYICNVEDLPENVGNSYTGVTLFTHENDEYIANYEESMDILEELFPKNKTIFLMCGGGGYAGMMKKLLVGLGWDPNKIYNVGGYWYYKGNNNVQVIYEENGETKYNYDLVNYHDIDFKLLTKLRESGTIEKDVDKAIEKSNFIRLKTVEDLQKLENENKTFPLFVFLSGCPSCAKFLPIVQEYSDKNNIQIYSIDLNDIWGNDNSVTERIKYAPSLFIYKDGEVIDFLESSNNEDYPMYQSVDKLSEWIASKIDINLFEECDDMRKVLFVCHGNICRSVMAEYILKSKTDDIYCESAATSSEEIGNDIYQPAKNCLDRHKISYDRHYARKVTADDYDRFDEIYVMDSNNLYNIKRIMDDPDNKIKKLCDYDIADPWYTDDFELTYRQLNEGIDKLL